MHQNDYNLIDAMNIQSDVIVINQSDRNYFDEFMHKDNKIKFLSFNERGIGLSRNNAFMRATADICLFADDDVTYVDDYKESILMSFKNNPKADIILFNVPSTNPDRPSHQTTKKGRVRLFNCLKYGAVRIAVRTEKVREENIHFSLLFGGGAKYGSGEDSLFIFECIKKGLKVYAEPKVIGYVSQESSSWFNGYTDKFFIDKGVLFACLSKRLAWLLCLRFVIRQRNLFKSNKSVKEAFKLMIEGTKIIKK
jgi:glycosyltransferase involved in cell wall biosynthesis